MSFVREYLTESIQILSELGESQTKIDALVDHLTTLRQVKGRLFFTGLGGSASTASHAANDFRKICAIESYSLIDNISELTARINDDGWDSCLRNILQSSKFSASDALFIFSVGGGDINSGVSTCLVEAVKYAKIVGGRVFGILGRDGGYVAQSADVSVIIPPKYSNRVTPHTEGISIVLLHLLISDPRLALNRTKWESIDE